VAFNNRKIDSNLGQQIHKYLEAKGVETPFDFELLNIENDIKIKKIEEHFLEIWKIMGLDMTDDSLIGTPARMAKMWVLETMWGMLPKNFPKCTTVRNKMHYDSMVVERNISVQSQCEHHGVVIDGLGTVAYIPNETVLGLSKINRIVEYFAKRPQIQERLTEQVFHALQFILETDNVAVIIDATHFCVRSRGVEDTSSSTVTSKLGGVFKDDPATRQEFMALFHSAK